MDTSSQAPLPIPETVDPSLSRRRFLTGAAIAGGGLVAAGLAACAPAATGAGWTFGPNLSAAPSPAATASAVAVASATPSPAASATASADPSPSASPSEAIPTGWTDHDIQARNVIRRYVGDLALAFKDIYPPAAYLKFADILGVQDDYPELKMKPAFVQVPNLVLTDALTPLTPEVVDGVKVFRLTIDEISQQIDEKMPPVAALGFNKQWPGPTIRVDQGDKVRAIFTNNMQETTGIHFHGVELDDFFQDGIPFLTQLPIIPGGSWTYEFTATTSGSLMYHSHHNATDQVGRGLLGAFVVTPTPNPAPADREYVWISNDELGGFTINGHGFPATVPVLAALGETVRIRFMNEGIMMHPWHLHGLPMRVVARDGHDLGSAAFTCDTLGVNPGERFDVEVKASTLGIWAFHCHILPHAEGANGMFGMVNTMIVVPEKSDVDAIISALIA
jgi:FtsP/CotA-like multicopper oxidase with cupredoxin domain